MLATAVLGAALVCNVDDAQTSKFVWEAGPSIESSRIAIIAPMMRHGQDLPSAA